MQLPEGWNPWSIPVPEGGNAQAGNQPGNNNDFENFISKPPGFSGFDNNGQPNRNKPGATVDNVAGAPSLSGNYGSVGAFGVPAPVFGLKGGPGSVAFGPTTSATSNRGPGVTRGGVLAGAYNPNRWGGRMTQQPASGLSSFYGRR